MHSALWAALAVVVVLPTESLPEPGNPGRLVIIGGALASDNEAIYRSILDAREGDGPICVIPTASADPESALASAVARFERWGGEHSALGLQLPAGEPSLADDPEIAGVIAGCGGFFFSGGVQSRIVDVFRPDGRSTAAYEALYARWRAGAVVSGSSAGAAIMSDPMIGGGSSAGAFRSGGFSGPTNGVTLEPGLGFVSDVLMDQHFLARGRIGRLLVAVLAGDTPELGAGIDENTALILDGHRAHVAGASGVVIVDAREAQRGQDVTTGADFFSQVRLELLGPGDSMDLVTGEVRPDPTKSALPALPETPEVLAPLPAGTLFEPWVLLHTLATWGAVGTDTLLPPAPTHVEIEGATLRFEFGEGFRGLMSGRGEASLRSGVRESPQGLSVGPIWVSGQWTGPEAGSLPDP